MKLLSVVAIVVCGLLATAAGAPSHLPKHRQAWDELKEECRPLQFPYMTPPALAKLDYTNYRPGKLAAALRSSVVPGVHTKQDACMFVKKLLCTEAVGGALPGFRDTDMHEAIEMTRRAGYNALDSATRVMGMILGLFDLRDTLNQTRFGDSPSVDRAVKDLQNTGFSFLNPVGDDVVDRILKGLSTEVFRDKMRPKSLPVIGPNADMAAKLAPGRTFWLLDRQAAWNIPDVQSIVTDPKLLAIAQSYLGSSVTLGRISVWLSTPKPKGTEKEQFRRDNQMFHVDKNFLHQVKVFVYLSDVGEHNGPHEFMEGSHNTYPFNGDDAYTEDVQRLSLPTQDVLNFYGKSKLRRMTGGRGTVLVEDVRGVHRGQPVVEGHRIIMQIVYTMSAYAGWDGLAHPLRDVPVPLTQHEQQFPRFYQMTRMGSYHHPANQDIQALLPVCGDLYLPPAQDILAPTATVVSANTTVPSLPTLPKAQPPRESNDVCLWPSGSR